MKVQFANGKVYNAQNIDDAIAQCLQNGDDPFKPEVIAETKEEKKTKNADTVNE